ncbi:hypothetical protein PR202_ga07225 [Eleusine coracana subsp. coracana]|uniref:Pectinesterase inhibitor domain-containing protein n=1 Tax=Eleusine coracana subsp. coracana TaxID=191504 RepID=A0AAV5BY46_ELECO|nr:hypothetical protein QOZ80_2AG0109790 [Eleusine coracana subsp. coracana]GJM90902.1 hypothetical protein PR202_ga07225 [Eleusine coracana subsp. coracana]
MAPHQPHAVSSHRHLVVVLLAVAAVATTRRAACAASTDGSSSFLRERCATTLDAGLCYDSLLPHAAEFQTSHVRLARVAADVAAAHLRALLANVKELLKTGTSAGDALHDCASTVSAAANLVRQSSAELAGLEEGGSSSRWGLSNAKTWLSAAITNEGTCADGINEAGAAAVSTSLDAGVAESRQHTSIALALVNGIPLQ